MYIWCCIYFFSFLLLAFFIISSPLYFSRYIMFSNFFNCGYITLFLTSLFFSLLRPKVYLPPLENRHSFSSPWTSPIGRILRFTIQFIQFDTRFNQLDSIRIVELEWKWILRFNFWFIQFTTIHPYWLWFSFIHVFVYHETMSFSFL